MVAYFKNEFTLFFGMSETKGYPWMLFLRRAGEACVSALHIGESLQINGIKAKAALLKNQPAGKEGYLKVPLV